MDSTWFFALLLAASLLISTGAGYEAARIKYDPRVRGDQ